MRLKTGVLPVFSFTANSGINSRQKCQFKHSIMKSITIEGQLRTETGKKATRQVRSQGLVPGVIYGGAQEVNFAAPVLAFKPLLYTPEFQVAEINVDGKVYRCILKDIQLNKVSDEVDHLDFLELVEDKPVIATLPIKFSGASIGVKEGGKFVAKMKNLKVKTLPKYLTENIEVDVTNLNINGNIRVEDVQKENDDTTTETGRSSNPCKEISN
jgi:large subunit ribosomal protein L25